MRPKHQIGLERPMGQIVSFMLLFILSSASRMIGLGWGLPNQYHCDERRLTQSSYRFSVGETTKPPDNVYSPLSAYLGRAAFLISGGRIAGTPPKTAFFLRGVSAVTSALTPPLLFLAAFALWGLPGSLTAALCLSFAPGAIREAHFATVDSFLTFSLVAVLAAGVLVLHRPTSRLWVLLPISVGLALAAKISALPVCFVMLLLVPRVSPAGSKLRLLTAPFVVAIVFAALAWDMVIDPRHYAFWAGKTGLDRAGVTLPYYSLQFNRTQPFGGLVSLVWMAGPFLLVGGVLGVVPLFRMFRRRPALLLVLIPPFFASLLECFTDAIPFVRYALPLVPLVALSTCSLIWFLWHRSRALAAVLAGFIVLGTGILGASYMTIYLKPDTRDQAEHWLEDHWEPRQIVLLDGTDDLVNLSSIPQRAQRTMYHPAQHALQEPVEAATLSLKDKLLFRIAAWGAVRKKDRALLEAVEAPSPVPSRETRLAVFNRQILHATWIVTTGTERARYLAHPDVFAPEIAFYDSLLSGRSGFQTVATFSAFQLPYPRFMTPEPTWFLFDHPRVTILRSISG